MQKNQSGSAHAIIIGLLTVALVGALGFIFWQNIIVKDSSDKSTVTADVNNIKKDKGNTGHYCSENEKLCFDYPSDWTVSKIKEDIVAADNISVSSPDKSVVLRLITGMGPMGLEGPIPDGPLTVIGVSPATRMGLMKKASADSTSSAYVSEVVVSKLEQKFIGNGPDFTTSVLGYYPEIVLHNSTKLSQKGTFQALNGMVGFMGLIPGKFVGKFETASIQFGVETDTLKAKPFATAQLAASQLKTESFRQAKAILLSARYE